MTRRLYEVPFTFTLSGKILVVASSSDEAHDLARNELAFDDSNLNDSNVFWDESAAVTSATVITSDPEIGEPVEVGIDRRDDLLAMYGLSLSEKAEEEAELEFEEDEDEEEEEDSTSERPGKV